MAEIVKETPTANDPNVNAPVKRKATGPQTVAYLVYFLFGILEIFLAFRLVLKLLGANLASGFVDFIYGVTGIFLAPFQGIFPTAVAPGLETRAVLEPATIVALIVYAVVAWGIVKLVQILSREPQDL